MRRRLRIPEAGRPAARATSLTAVFAALAWSGGALLIASAVLASSIAGELPPPAEGEVDFAKDIEPLLKSRCHKCHGPEKAESGLRLHTRDDALAGGDSGTDIEPGDSEGSRLVQYIAGQDEDRVMPPPGQGDRLSDEEIGLIRTWIDEGAEWPESEDDR